MLLLPQQLFKETMSLKKYMANNNRTDRGNMDNYIQLSSRHTCFVCIMKTQLKLLVLSVMSEYEWINLIPFTTFYQNVLFFFLLLLKQHEGNQKRKVHKVAK